MSENKDWSQFYNEATPQEIDESFKQENIDESERKTITLSEEDLQKFLNRISGKTEKGESKILLSYQNYNFDSLETDPDRDRIIQCLTPYIRIVRNSQYNDLYTVDIVFPNCESDELRFLWKNLEKHMDNQLKYPTNRWVFYFNILEKEDILLEENAPVLTVNIINPLICFLTRQVPDMKTNNEVKKEEIMQGGNIIRMLVTNENLTFSLNKDIDVLGIKSEVLREIQENEE